MRGHNVYAALANTVLLAAVMPTHGGCQLVEIAQLPVTIESGRALVPAKVNGQDVTMMIDSGAFWSMLTLAAAKHANLQPERLPYGFRLSGFNGNAEVSMSTVKEFKLENVRIPNIQFLVGGTEFGAGASGIIGQNVLSWQDVEYDLGNGVVRLMHPKDCDKQSLAYWVKTEPLSMLETKPITPAAPHTIADAYLNGSKIRVMFDSGTPLSILSRRAAEKAGFKIDGAGVEATGTTSGLGQKWIQTWSANFDSFKLGGEEILHAKLRVGDISIENADMLLGLDFFLSHHIYVSHGQHLLYFTYNGGPVFNLKSFKAQPAAEAVPEDSLPSAAPAAVENLDAPELSRRGMALAARHEYEQALQDLNRACEVAPQESTYFVQRGLVEWQSGHGDLALRDFDRALLLKPDNLEALEARLDFRRRSGDPAGALSDLNAAANAANKESSDRLDFGTSYAQMDLYRQAIAQYDLWIAVHPDDARLAVALNDRCWARALLGEELDLALSDCNKSLSLNSKNGGALDSRGLVRLRRGEYKKALSDYNDSLALQPRNVWSLYGRGLTKLHLGMNVEGQADIAAAQAVRPKMAELAAKYGIVP